MKTNPFRAALLALALSTAPLAGLGLAGLAHAAEITIGTLTLVDPYVRATLPNAPVGGGFVTISNTGAADDRLISASSPAAGIVQIHEMKMDGDVMKMAELPEGLVLPAGQSVELKPGGFHIMFMQLKQQFVEGTTVPVTLTFEKAGSINVEFAVKGIAAGSGNGDMSQMNHDMSGADAHSGHDHAAGMAMDMSGMSDAEAISAMQKAMFDKPDNPLTMGPVVVAGDYAVSDWAQAGSGGRALLKKTEKGWGIHLCAGDALKDAAELAKIGVPADIASKLAADLAAAEGSVDPALLKQFSMFDGVMMVDESLI